MNMKANPKANNLRVCGSKQCKWYNNNEKVYVREGKKE